MKERTLEEVELKEYEGYRVGDRVSFIKPKDWLIERIVKRTIEITYIEDNVPVSCITNRIFFIEGAGWARPGAFKEFMGKGQFK